MYLFFSGIFQVLSGWFLFENPCSVGQIIIAVDLSRFEEVAQHSLDSRWLDIQGFTNFTPVHFVVKCLTMKSSQKFYQCHFYLTLWELGYDIFVLWNRLKTSSCRLPHQRHSSSADCARELFKGSNGSASLLVCTRSVFFLYKLLDLDQLWKC